jgi:twinkle protein
MKQVEEMCADNLTDTLVWTEGEFDCMSFAEIGIPAVSVPAGASSTKMDYIDNCYEWIRGFKTHIIAVDSDDVGKLLRDNLIIRLGKECCKVINFEDFGVKDSNELLIKSKDFLKEAFDSAKYLTIDRTITYDDVKHQVIDLYNNKNNTGLSTGWKNLDHLMKIKKGKLMIVSGFPTRGKSFWVDNLLLNLTEAFNWKHFLFTFETDPKHHFARMCSMRTRKNFFGNGEKVSEDEVRSNLDYFNKCFLFSDNEDTWNLEQIKAKATDMIKHRGVDTIVIDPFDRLEIPAGAKEYIYIRQILSELSAFAKKMDVLVIFIAHPKKPDGDEAPNMYSISGSTAWYNAADYGVIIHRDRNEETKKLDTTTQVIICKIKDVDMGDPSGGVAELDFINHRLKEAIR